MIAAAGAIALLIKWLQAVGPEELQAGAALVLANLACKDAQMIITAGAIPLMVKLLRASSMEARERAAYALHILAKMSAPTLRSLRRIRSSPWWIC